MKKSKLIVAVTALILQQYPLLSEATVVINSPKSIYKLRGEDFIPSGKGWGIPTVLPSQEIPGASTPPNNKILYHNGPVMGVTSTTIPNIYYIWYGNWTGNTAISILENFASGIGNTSYYNINTTYYDVNHNNVIKAVNFPRVGIYDNYSQGSSLTDEGVLAVVNQAISTNALPLDSNGIYFVLTSADVAETSGFCSFYCGWHNYGDVQGTTVKYAFVGNPDRCPSSCTAQTVSPNNNPGADGMANVIAHELEETVTDPMLNAWYDNSGQENADKCAWQFGKTSKASNGSLYNVSVNSLNYLIQMNWLNARGGKCANSY